MPVYQDKTTKTWFVKLYYTDYTGTRKQKLKAAGYDYAAVQKKVNELL